jgi:uncharacterized membrane protein
MRSKATITVLRPPDEVRQLWSDPRSAPPALTEAKADVTFRPAPGDRGTEVHVDLGGAAAPVSVLGRVSPAKAKDELRRFKQVVETGEVVRSEGVPQGENAGRKLHQHPAQPLEAGSQ